MKAAANDLRDPQDMSVKIGLFVGKGHLERVRGRAQHKSEEAGLVGEGVSHGTFLTPKVDAEIHKMEILGR